MGPQRMPDKQVGHAKFPRPLEIFAWGLPFLWLLSIIKVVIERRLHSAEPWVLPHHFDDFICYWMRLRFLHTLDFFEGPDGSYFGSGWGYPAPAIWIYRFFYLFDPLWKQWPWRGLGVMVAIGLALTTYLAYRLFRSFQNRGLSRLAAVGLVASAVVCSWPLIFVVQRGNIELLLWLPVAAAIFAFAQGRWNMAAVLIGLTASFKLYPIILLALFLRDRRYLQILLGCATSVLSTVLSLWYIGPTLRIAWNHMGLGVSGFIEEHGAHIDWTKEGYNHSLFHLVKVVEKSRQDQLGHLITPYMLGIALLMTVVFFFRVIRLPAVNQVMVLVISMVYLPATSYDYTLQVLFVPWAWLALIAVAQARRRVRLPGMLTAMILFTLVLGPELFLSTARYLRSGTIKSICLGLLLVLACTYRFEDPDRVSLTSAA